MCHSVRGLLIGTLVFSVIYILAGCVQSVIGIVFMVALPIFKLGSNVWTGALNILIGGAMSSLVCCGQPSSKRHRICLGLSIAVVLVNLSNLLILEICEWRAFLPPTRVQELMKDDKTDLLLAAYLSSTISTAIALVVGFVACEYIYCLLIATTARNEENKTENVPRRRSFPKRNRRASWYEPISFSWVFEATDQFNTSQGSARAQQTTCSGVSNKTFQSTDLTDNKENGTYVIPKTPSCGTSSTVPISELVACNGTMTVAQEQPSKKRAMANGTGPPQTTVGRVGADSKSSSGYSSPDWMTQRCNVRNLSEHRIGRGEKSSDRNEHNGRGHHHQPRFQEQPPPTKNRHAHQPQHHRHHRQHHHHHHHQQHEREVRSLVQLPIHYEAYQQEEVSDNCVHMSPMRQATLPSHGARKRKDDNKGKGGGRHKHSRSPRKRHKSSSGVPSDILSSPIHGDYEFDYLNGSYGDERRKYARPRLSSTPERSQPEIIEIHNVSSIEPTYSCGDISVFGHSSSGRNTGHNSTCNLSHSTPSQLPMLEVPFSASANVSRKSSLSDEIAIVDVTANFHNPNATTNIENAGSSMASVLTESMGRLSSSSDSLSEDGLALSNHPSLHDSLTSVTCPEDGLSPLSDYGKEQVPLQTQLKNGLLTVPSPASSTGNDQTLVEPSHKNSDNENEENSDEATGATAKLQNTASSSASKENIPSSEIENSLSYSGDNMNDQTNPSGTNDLNKETSSGNEVRPSAAVNIVPSNCSTLSTNSVGNEDNENRSSPQSCDVSKNSASTSSLGSSQSSQRRVYHLQSHSVPQESLQRSLRKKAHRKTLNRTWTLSTSKHHPSEDGISFQSLEKKTKPHFSKHHHGPKKCFTADSRSDPLLHWKSTDSPHLNPFNYVDEDSLVNLTNLELIARHWRNCTFHKQLHQQLGRGKLNSSETETPQCVAYRKFN